MTNRKCFLAILTVCVLLCVQAAAEPAETLAVISNPNPSDWLNLRSAPSSQSSVVGRYDNGVIVRVLEQESSGYVHVAIGYGTGEISGYMDSRFLAFDSSKAANSAVKSVSVGSLCGGSGRWLCTTPSQQTAMLLVWLPADAPVIVLGQIGDALHVQAAGLTGFLFADGAQSALSVQTSQPQVTPVPLWSDWQQGLAGSVQTAEETATPTPKSANTRDPNQLLYATAAVVMENGWTETAYIRENTYGQYTVGVSLAQGWSGGDLIIAYNLYADGRLINVLLSDDDAGTGQGPTSFSANFSYSQRITQCELRPIYASTGMENSVERDYIRLPAD